MAPLLRKRPREAAAPAPAGCPAAATSQADTAPTNDARGERPALLVDLPPDRILDLDIRCCPRAGWTPFSRVIAGKQRLAPGDVLRVRSRTPQAALCEEMARRGFAHWRESTAEDGFRIWFFRRADLEERTAEAGTGNGRATGPAEDAAPPNRTLDVRGMRFTAQSGLTLSALERLPAGASLVHINEEVPLFLFPLLETRGYHYEIAEQSAGEVRIRIRRRDRRCRLGAAPAAGV